MTTSETPVVHYPRPRTYRELMDRMNAGEACEVVSHAGATVTIMLKGWLEFGHFSIRVSENPGYHVFEKSTPTSKESHQ